tara:strand:- start:389 stop:679 length:291 start_codon:yes stop_codon:yes gene_type:complete
MTKAEKILEKHLVDYDTISYTDEDYKLKQCYLNAINEAINYTRCCTELKDKKITDLLNWVKSDLAQETNVKLGKTVTPYRTEKLKFLNKLLEIENL